MAKDLVKDVLEGKSFSEAAENQIEVAKNKIGQAIRQKSNTNSKKRKQASQSVACNFKKKKCFNLLDD